MKLHRQPLFLLDPDPTGGDPAPPAPEPPAARTFSQEEVDRIVQERVARVKREEPSDYAELKAAAAELKEIKKSQLTELEQAQTAREEAEARAAQAIERANRQLIEAAVLSEATKAKATRPEHLHRLIDMNSVTVGDDGQVTGAQEAVTAFLEANPEYVGKGRVIDSVDQGARGTTPNQLTQDDLRSMSAEEIVAAQKEGRLNGLLGIS